MSSGHSQPLLPTRGATGLRVSEHRFVIEVLKNEETLGQFPLPLWAFDPAVESLRFLEIRRGLRFPTINDSDLAVLEPVWDREAGAPRVEAFRMRLVPSGPGGGGHSIESDDGTGLRVEIPLVITRGAAVEVTADLVKEGKLTEGETFRYRVLAFPGLSAPVGHEAEGPAQRDGGLAFESVAQPLDVDDRPLAEFTDRAVFQGPDSGGGMPVLLPDLVLQEAEALKVEAGECETGGVLIGHLHRDRDLPEVYVEVTAQIPARHVEATSSRLTFTAETWADVRNAIEIRRRGEIMVGWWHSHPAREWCKDCDPSRWSACRLARAFFSKEDRQLHATVFPRAYSVALVVGDRVGGDRSWEGFSALYGWDHGLVVERGFHVLDGRAGDQ